MSGFEYIISLFYQAGYDKRYAWNESRIGLSDLHPIFVIKTGLISLRSNDLSWYEFALQAIFRTWV